MRYESNKTTKGNIGVSYTSQECADAQASMMDANNCSNCSNCYDCSYCSYCSNCSNCSGSMRWTGGKVKKLLSMNGLRWPVSVSETHMQIGCKNYSHEEWEGFNDKQIRRMDYGAFDFWQTWKPTLIAMCTYKKGE